MCYNMYLVDYRLFAKEWGIPLFHVYMKSFGCFIEEGANGEQN